MTGFCRAEKLQEGKAVSWRTLSAGVLEKRAEKSQDVSMNSNRYLQRRPLCALAR